MKPWPMGLRAAVGVSALLVCGALAGCIDGFEPDLGQRQLASCRDRDSDPDTDVSFAKDIMLGIFRGPAECLPCHDPNSNKPLGYQTGGLDLTSHSTLMAGGTNSATDIVLPGQPCSSRLVQKVGSSPPSGSRMPLAGAALSDAQVQLLADWIVEGAKDN